MPNISEIIDLASVFHQIKMASQDSAKTAVP